MPATNVQGLTVRSKAFALWKDKEKREGRKITIDALAKETRLAKMTVRRFLATDGDVSGSPLAAAAVLAVYFGTGLDDLLTVEKEETG